MTRSAANPTRNTVVSLQWPLSASTPIAEPAAITARAANRSLRSMVTSVALHDEGAYKSSRGAELKQESQIGARPDGEEQAEPRDGNRGD
jgi:hypothetical protein